MDPSEGAPARGYDKPILVVDDDPHIVHTLEQFLEAGGFKSLGHTSPAKALEAVREGGIEIVLSDINMPEMDGLQLLRRFLELDPEIAVVMMTAFGSEKVAVEAMKAGAYHYLSKPVNLDELLLLIRRAVDRLRLVRENRVLRTQNQEMTALEDMVGRSPGLERVRQLVRRVAMSAVSVLITGESGTGKELVAQSLHALSDRSKGPFVKVNCAAIPETLLESELFGHERGAFTGAVARRIGKFELANGGTLFFDEVGDMTLTTQTKLLRVLQDQEFERIGGKDTIRVDVRVLAATNSDLARGIAAGRFREDLFYRLNVIEILVPPLRERSDDIPLLVQHFVDAFAQQYGKERLPLSPSIMERLRTYPWPGNIRQLRNCLERAVILGQDKPESFELPPPVGIQPEASSSPLSTGTSSLSLSSPPLRSESDVRSLDDVELDYIRTVLAFTGGNKAQTARLLRIDPKTLRAKLKRAEAA